MSNKCVACGSEIPEGMMVCGDCLKTYDVRVSGDFKGDLVINDNSVIKFNLPKQSILIEDQIKQRLHGVTGAKAYYIVEFNYGNIEVKELDSKTGKDILDGKTYCEECALR